MGESVNAVNVIFGDAAGEVLAFSESSANSIGLTQQGFNQALVPMGALLQNFGLSADDAANQSIALANRAADLASVFNVDLSVALDAINSGLKGEADPLEQFGIGLGQSSLEAFALAQGIETAVKDMTEQEKVLLRLNAIFAQSESSAGDFEATQGSAANATRILTSSVNDSLLPIGMAFLPLAEALLAALVDWTPAMAAASESLAMTLAPALESFAGNLPQYIKNVAAFSGALR